MTESERLKELLLKCDPIKERDLDDDWGDGEIDDIVDSLLENGVIVPPCKVGTTLFFIYNSPYADKPDLTPRIYKTTDWYFEVDKAGIVINTSDIHSFNKVYDYVLGKTVFLSREESEKVLAERSKI